MSTFDPDSREIQADPYPAYRELRDQHPVFYNAEKQFWALSRYDDVVDALRRPEVFSSRRALDDPSADPATILPMIVIMDPPRQIRLRSLVSRAFTPRRIADLERRIRVIATDLIDGFIERGQCDLFRELSAPLPTIVIAELLGVPAEDREMFKENSTIVASSVSPGGDDKRSYGAAAELSTYLERSFEEKRRHPGDDLMSALLEAEIDGERLTQAELLGFAFLLLLAGNETTTNLISNATVLLYRFPDERRRLVTDPSLIPSAVEEFLRYESPVQGVERLATREVDVGGKTMKRGDKVFVLLASANRDERHIPEPDRFDVGRDPNKHLAFGLGTHFCLGASLARLEARVAWEEILKRMPEFQVSGPTQRLPSPIFRGLLSLPLEFQPVAA